jgi:hypothetical protein
MRQFEAVVFLPGILASELEFIDVSGSGRVVWDGNLLTIANTLGMEPEVLHAATRLTPTKIIERLTLGPLPLPGYDVYTSLLTTVRSLGYTENDRRL